MVDPKMLSRQVRDTIRKGYEPHGDRDAINARRLLDSHEAADAELTRLTDENTALRLQLTSTWRCFHCGFATDIRDLAEAHFGDVDELEPICLDWNRMNETERLGEFQSLLRELAGERLRVADLESAVDGVRKAIEGQMCALTCQSRKFWPFGDAARKVHDGACNCWKARALAILPAPGQSERSGVGKWEGEYIEKKAQLADAHIRIARLEQKLGSGLDITELVMRQPAIESNPLSRLSMGLPEDEAGFEVHPAEEASLNKTWAILFEDAELPPELFTDEGVARKAYADRLLNWNCRLFSVLAEAGPGIEC